MLIGLYIVDAIIIAVVLYGCCKKYDLKDEQGGEEELDIENPNYLSFYNE
uniref:Uncharacterized protein n=1 Tax=viral metagenome TaxID=1070528 RepID=A0A6C0C4V4_9ZZZZ